ncbi:MAG: cysteine-rich CWC family protein [Aromatoleum sp.]|jgi:hypothetical protein|uniref:cysteine-rich CWC family protein n=1 Tax=Aromatoleum sp. TaxID=2307007 RepID=UPI0028953666|nr:cysteine-rich CWC family protein [Aromatoleum sp.]MDT3670703.1 cysteine-rich CWC family protein [Aromatoleum sp.]
MNENTSRDATGAASNLCSRCGAGFTCGMQAGWTECWCATLPVLETIPDAAAGCYCPDCLKLLLGSGSAAMSDGSARD